MLGAFIITPSPTTAQGHGVRHRLAKVRISDTRHGTRECPHCK
jgi:hypothetical protein